MFSGFYTAASGMLINRRALDITADNMANQKTPGYRSKRLMGTTFDQELVRQTGTAKTPVGQGSPIAIVAGEATNFEEGIIVETDNPYNMAIHGDGFFVIRGDNGEYLTRNGNFDKDEDGFLVLPGKGYVMGDMGPIEIGEDGFNVGSNGVIYDNEGGELDLFSIVDADDYDNLTVYDNGMFGAGTAQLTESYPEIYQGRLEQSNVNLNDEMTRTMEIQRAFQSCSRALTIIDQMNQKTVSEIGKI